MSNLTNSANIISNQEFFNNWHVYQKVVANNYMRHQELYAELGELLYLLPTEQKPLKLLDIGCGDAYYSAKTLSCIPLDSYCGIDSSEQALYAAEKNLTTNGIFNASLIHGDLSEVLDEIAAKSQTFDVVFSCFCLHHYQNFEIGEIFSKIKRVLSKNGIFIVIDIFRSHNQTREDYLISTMGRFYKSLLNLSQDEIDKIQEHVENSDFPNTHLETKSTFLNHGFNNAGLFFNIEHYAIYWAK